MCNSTPRYSSAYDPDDANTTVGVVMRGPFGFEIVLFGNKNKNAGGKDTTAPKVTPATPGAFGKPKRGLSEDQLNMQVRDYIGLYREGSINKKFPGEYYNMTVREALQTGTSRVRKLLTSDDYAKK